jgi:hypothetical protein
MQTHPTTTSTFRVLASVALEARVEIVLKASTKEGAVAEASRLLTAATYSVTTVAWSETNTAYTDLGEQRIEPRLLECAEVEPEYEPGSPKSIRALAEAMMGHMILAEMEGLEHTDDGLSENRANIRAGMADEMANGLFHDLWALYLTVHPEHALPTEPEVDTSE